MRWASKRENRFNHGQLGVCYHAAKSRWVAQICFNYINLELGYYQAEAEARIAYLAAAKTIAKFTDFDIEQVNVIDPMPVPTGADIERSEQLFAASVGMTSIRNTMSRSSAGKRRYKDNPVPFGKHAGKTL